MCEDRDCQRDVPKFELLSAVIGLITPYGLSGALESFPKKEIKDGHSLGIAPVRSFTLLRTD